MTSLWPREHGAYAELVFPLATGLVLGGPSLAGGCLALAAVSLFLAHEPFAVLTGRRGARPRIGLGAAARWRFGLLVVVGVVVGACGVVLGGPATRAAVLVPLVPALAVVPTLLRGRQKTLPAELSIVAVFSGSAVPLVVAGGGRWFVGWIAAGVWCVSFGLGTVAVHVLKRQYKRRDGASMLRASVLVLGGTIGAVALGAAGARHVPLPAALALLPPVVASAGIVAVPVHPRRLRTVGWSLVSANVLTMLCLVFL